MINLIEGLDLGEDTRFWTEKFVKNITPFIEGYKDRPTNYLEIGVFAGITSQWMLENVLTHPDSNLVGIDPWDFSKLGTKIFSDDEIGHKRYEDMMRGLENLKIKYSSKVQFFKGYSKTVLRDSNIPIDRFGSKYQWRDNFFDIIYVDGGHWSLDVILDFALTWPLLKVGGLMIFDDYKLKVKPAVDYIILCLNQANRSFNKKCRVMFQENDQCGIRKMRD